MKVFFLASFSESGLSGLMKSSYAARKDMMRQIAQSVGGKLHAMTFLQGPYDVLVEMELDSAETAAGVATTVRLSGALEDVLYLPEFDIDKAISAFGKVTYRAPGSESSDFAAHGQP